MKIDITILGLLTEGDLYGYEIKKKIVERLEDYVDIKFGSIYYAIKKAVESGWVQKVSTEKDSGNPERYVYEILPAGKKHYRKLLKQYFDQNLIHFDIDIILMFYKNLPEENRSQFKEDRLDSINLKLQNIEEKIEMEKNIAEDQSNKHLLNYIKAHLLAEIEWINSLN